jgi:hypothetical protein
MTDHEPQKRQTCARCLRTVGVLPNGRALPYRTERYADGRRFHYCLNERACTMAHAEAQARLR